MAKAEPVGHMACPECGFPDAEIKKDKNGNPYRYCPDCSAQYMTHGRPHKVKNLEARMRAVVVAVKEAIGASPEPMAETHPPAPAPKKKGLIL